MAGKAHFAGGVVALLLILVAGATPVSAQVPHSPVPQQTELAQSKQQINPCFLPGRVPCGTTCCPPGYRCGDSKCHKRPVKGGGVETAPQQTQ